MIFKSRTKPVFIVVQHLAPGGIEVLALNLLAQLKEQSALRIISLEGSKEAVINSWPVLAEY